MPNWVMNVIKFDCSEERLNDIRKAIGNYEEDGSAIDFNKLIPMPESLNVSEGGRSDRAEKCYKAYLMDSEQVVKEKYKLSDEEFEELKKDGEIYASNREKYGHRSWYGWAIENWGTKWNATEALWAGDNTLSFQTAWSCPEPIFNKLAKMFPDVGFTVRYADEGMSYNCGTLEYSNGELYSENLEPDASYDFALDVWGYDEEGKKEYLEEIGE